MSRNASGVLHRDLARAPTAILRGDGVWLEAEDGRRYLDGSASASVVSIGHGRTEIWDALAAEGDRVTFVSAMTFTHPWQEQLAAELLRLAPANMAAAYFVSGGSEANETAWKIARQYHVETGKPQKYKAIARSQSYHGTTLATLSLSGRTSWRRMYSPLLLDVPHVAPPYRYRCAFCAGAPQCSLACADDLERAILMEGPETVAAFFAEPVVGTTAAGLVPSADYYRRIREICDRNDVLFVADEVLCGYGRTGTAFAMEHFGVVPDIVTMGKGLAGGYAPLGAVLVSEGIKEALAGGSARLNHVLTFSGMPSATFVGLKVNEIMRREGLFDRAAETGPILRRGLERLALEHEIVGEVRGLGLLQGVEFVADRRTRRPFAREARVTDRIVSGLRDRGVIVAAGTPLSNHGRDGDHIQISPPLIIGEDEIAHVVGALDDVLDELA